MGNTLDPEYAFAFASRRGPLPFFHVLCGLEEEILAVLCLVNRVGVLETGSLLFGHIQSKAQTR